MAQALNMGWFAILDGVERRVLNGEPFYWPSPHGGKLVYPYQKAV